MSSKVTDKEKQVPSIRPYRATGKTFNCIICGCTFYRRASQIKRGITKTCGKSECKSKASLGDNNTFWQKNPNAWKSKQYTKRINLVRDRWIEIRNKALEAMPSREHNPLHKNIFSQKQRADWIGTKCEWCDSTENLELDHIIPIMCGGKPIKDNSQTLCLPCNKWKMKFVDKPLYLAGFRLP